MNKMTPDEAQFVSIRDGLMTMFKERQEELEEMAEGDDLISDMAGYVLADLDLDAVIVFDKDQQIERILEEDSIDG